jgi:A nuclease family of the HNH/ENDO VII superfamily with conserved AHH
MAASKHFKIKRNEAHGYDMLFFEELHKPACLTAHYGKFSLTSTCSYRGQAYTHGTTATRADGPVYRWPDKVAGPPRKSAWDLGVGSNFKERADVPFPHEAHHIVAYAELANAIAEIGTGTDHEVITRFLVRIGLAEEGYNLNDKLNMIILPVNAAASRALRLPRHLKTKSHRSHPMYSRWIRSELDDIFAPMKKTVQNCKGELPEYRKSRKKIEAISEDVFPRLLTAQPSGFDHLDSIPNEHLAGKKATPSAEDY